MNNLAALLLCTGQTHQTLLMRVDCLPKSHLIQEKAILASSTENRNIRYKIC